MSQENHILNAYFRTSLAMVRGEGAFLYDEHGNRYLDFASGIAVTNLGHAHPALVKALCEQSQKLWHCSNLFCIPEQQALATKLATLTFADKVFFCSSGLEANEAAIKIMRKHYYHKNPDKKTCTIITLEGGFHGRSLATISAGNNSTSISDYGPLLPGFRKVQRNNISDFEKAIDDTVAGILIEPVQSEGGIYPIEKAYLNKVREITKTLGIAMCLDEVQTGYGRLGSLFAYQQMLSSPPDILTTAKGMGNGFPIGACLMTEEFARVINPGDHGSTYGGNPLAMRVGNAVLDIIADPLLMRNVAQLSSYLAERIGSLQKQFPQCISDFRHQGLILGLELQCSARGVLERCLSKKLITTRCKNDQVLRLLPPLIINIEQANMAVDILETVFNEMLGSPET